MAANTWTHYDPNLADNAAKGRARARSGDWSSGMLGAREDEFRGLLAETCFAMAYMAGEVVVRDSEAGQVAAISLVPRAGVQRERLEVAGRLYATLRVLQLDDGGGLSGGIETRAQPDVGALPAVAVVAIVAVGVIGVGYCAHQAAQVIDRQLARREKSRLMLQQHEAALEVVEKHQEREKTAGKPLPLDAASRRVLDALRKAQEAIAQDREQPYEPFVPRAVQTGAGWALGTVPLVVGGVVLAYLLLK